MRIHYKKTKQNKRLKLDNDEFRVGGGGKPAELARVRDEAHALKGKRCTYCDLRFQNASQQNKTKKENKENTSLKFDHIGGGGEAAELARVRDEAHAIKRNDKKDGKRLQRDTNRDC